MIDPFPIPPPRALVAFVKPYADALSLQSLPLHIHEAIFAAALYTFIYRFASPFLSRRLCPRTYNSLSTRTRINWDVHVVSFFQAVLINALSLWVMWFDEERKVWRDNANWEMRIWGYHGSAGLCQSFALGYFLWDMVMSCLHIDIFGWGMLAHAVSATAVFGIGYRPFVYFAAPIFLLYELSSPFLNIHWFCDKLGLTGSIYQAINGVFLTGTFFGCRIVWGLYSSVWVFRDMYWVIRDGHSNYTNQIPEGKLSTLTVDELMAVSKHPHLQLTAFNREQYLPLWIPIVYLTSNVVLNSLNVFWFGKMIETIRTRFDPPFGTRGVGPETVAYEPEDPSEKARSLKDQVKALGASSKEQIKATVTNAQKAVDGTAQKQGSIATARMRAEEQMNGKLAHIDGDQKVLLDGANSSSAEVMGSQRRSAKSRRKA